MNMKASYHLTCCVLFLVIGSITGATCNATSLSAFNSAPSTRSAPDRLVGPLIEYIRQVIKDETDLVPVKTLHDFVAKYQLIAIKSGVTDIDRQAQYVLLALYTTGKGVEDPLCISLMAHPPKSLDNFHAAINNLPARVWAAGPPLWETASIQKPLRSEIKR